MSLDAHLEAAVADAARKVLPGVLAELGQRDRLVHVRECRIGYRRALEAIKAGELRAFRVGHGTWIETAAEDAYIMAHPVELASAEPTAAPEDEIGELLEIDKRRRGQGGKGRAA